MLSVALWSNYYFELVLGVRIMVKVRVKVKVWTLFAIAPLT